MLENEGERRHGHERRLNGDRRREERRRPWWQDRRQKFIVIGPERRCGSDQRSARDRRTDADRRFGGDRRGWSGSWCETVIDGDRCNRPAVLRSEVTGAWHCFDHLGLEHPERRQRTGPLQELFNLPRSARQSKSES